MAAAFQLDLLALDRLPLTQAFLHAAHLFHATTCAGSLSRRSPSSAFRRCSTAKLIYPVGDIIRRSALQHPDIFISLDIARRSKDSVCETDPGSGSLAAKLTSKTGPPTEAALLLLRLCQLYIARSPGLIVAGRATVPFHLYRASVHFHHDAQLIAVSARHMLTDSPIRTAILPWRIPWRASWTVLICFYGHPGSRFR